MKYSPFYKIFNMKKVVKILKNVQSYENGKVYRLHGSFASSLIKRGNAVEVLPKVEPKEEKKVIETKEEKHAPEETKERLSIKKLSEVIGTYSKEELAEIVKSDDRVTARKLAESELSLR